MSKIKHDLVCCSVCGRDTKARTGVCGRCQGETRHLVSMYLPEDKGRHANRFSDPADVYDYDDDPVRARDDGTEAREDE